MRDCAVQPSVLQDRAAGHPLHDTACFGKQRLVRHGNEQVPAIFRVCIHTVNADGKTLHLIAVDI